MHNRESSATERVRLVNNVRRKEAARHAGYRWCKQATCSVFLRNAPNEKAGVAGASGMRKKMVFERTVLRTCGT